MKRGRDYLSKPALLKPRASISNHSLDMSLHTWALFEHGAWEREGQGLRLHTPLSSGFPAAWSGGAPSFPEPRPWSKAQVYTSSPCEAPAAVYAGGRGWTYESRGGHPLVSSPSPFLLSAGLW